MQTTAARLGGDEFILLLDQLRGPADAVRVAERVLANLSAPYRIGGHTIHSTASIGITTSGVGYTSAGDMLRDADTAMYRAKAAGKARYVLFDTPHARRGRRPPDPRERPPRRPWTAASSPSSTSRSSAWTAAATAALEVLLRWNHPTRGPVPPAVFVPLAEELGGMVAIGDWVMDAACRQLADVAGPPPRPVRRRGGPPEPVPPAADRRRLRRPPGRRPGRARPARRRPSTWSSPSGPLADDPAAAAAALDQLRGLGVELHLDNFGTGQSSLSCLHRYPLSGLKLGGGFTRDALTRPADRTVLAAVVGLARDLDLHLVAEGIETPEQVALLRQLGCDRAQGYHFARPLDPPAAEAFVVGGGRGEPRRAMWGTARPRPPGWHRRSGSPYRPRRARGPTVQPDAVPGLRPVGPPTAAVARAPHSRVRADRRSGSGRLGLHRGLGPAPPAGP